MLKDITLGQYFPGNTLAHRLDPRTKLMMVVIYIIALFCAKSFFSYGLLALFQMCIRDRNSSGNSGRKKHNHQKCSPCRMARGAFHSMKLQLKILF